MRPNAPLAWLLIAPGAIAAGCVVLPRFPMGEAATNLVAAALPCGAGLAALTLASRADPPLAASLVLGGASAALLGVLAGLGVTSAAGVVGVALALVVVSHTLGASIGRRIAHAGHVAPACAIAAAADIASIVSPEGPTHAIATSDAALSVLAIAGGKMVLV